NIISFNTGNGVTVGTTTGDSAATANDIQYNSITANTGLGISLGGGTTPIPNDFMNHVGPNHYQNYPILTSFSPVAAGLGEILGSFTQASEPSTDLRINFYADPGDPSHSGEGAIFLGSQEIETGPSGGNPTGFAPIDATVPAPPNGYAITATATVTDPGGNI